MERLDGQADLNRTRGLPTPRRTAVNWYRTLGTWAFGAFRVPLIFFVRPEVLVLDQEEVVVRVRLSRRTSNHHGTMYFGAIAIGADVVPGMFAVAMGMDQKRKVSFFVKDARFELRRKASGHVLFRCTQGAVMADLIARSLASGNAASGELQIEATLESTGESVASFVLNMSIKAS